MDDKKNENSEIEEQMHLNQSLSRRTVLGGTLAGVMGVISTASADAVSGDNFTAVNDGNWSDPGTWESGSVPTDGSEVSIKNGVTVTVNEPITTRIKYLNVGGTLRHAPDRDSKLRAETIETEPGSSYEIGTSSTPVERGVRAEVEFIDEGPIDENEWPNRHNKGLLAKGDVEIVGAEKTPWTTLAQHPTAGDSSIELSAEPTNWNPGDKIVVPGMDPYGSISIDNKDEKRTISSISGSTVTLESALDYDHVPPKSELDTYVLNLSRNIVMRSENTDEHRRGHVMIMSTGSEVRYARLYELGRTNKDEYITNPVRGEENLPEQDDPNPAARYPFHYHRTGIEAEPHQVEGLVVDGSPGWGIVNHHAHAEVTDSITYGVLGAGFVAEGGNERGTFKRNFALRSEGSGETIDSRAFGDHGGSPAIDDFGHAGHGFWMQSPLVELVDNVAAGHRHQAFVYWLRPLLDEIDETLAECSDVDDSRVTFCPNVPMEYVRDGHHDALLEAIEEQRFSTDSRDQLMWDTQKVPSCFVRIKKCMGNEAFASAGGLDVSRLNFKWKHERFSDFSIIDDLTVYNIGPFIDSDGDVHEPDMPRHKAAGHQGRGGNIGVSFRYVSNIKIKDSYLHGSNRPNSIAIPYHDYRWTNVVENCTIKHWDWGVVTGEHRLNWIRNNTFSDNDVDVHWSFDNVGPTVLEGNDVNRVQNKFRHVNEKASEVLEFAQDQGVVVNGRTAHVKASAPDFIPFPDEDALGGVNNIEDIESVDNENNLIGMTNAEMLDQYGICISGALLPDDAVTEPYLDGCLLNPEGGRSPPTSVYLGTGDMESFGQWEAVSDVDAAGGECLRVASESSPKDNPATATFDCAAGTYKMVVRARPSAWNGDDIYFRIDGGDWKTAEKLKTPIGFAWHDVELNNSDEDHTWDLVEGVHTIEFACDNDGVLVDQILLVSDATIPAPYGRIQSDQDSEPSAPDQTSYTDHDLSRIQAEDFDLGGEGVAYHDTSNGNNGGAYRKTDVDVQETSDDGGGYNIGWIEDGEWWEYTVDVPEDGDYTLAARLAGKNATTLDVSVDGSQVATIDVPNTGGWQTWTTVEAGNVTLSGGTHTVRATANGGDFNINWFGFEHTDATAPTAPSDLSASNVTDSSVDLSWDAASDSETGVDYYKIYRDGTALRQVSAGSTTATVDDLSASTSYNFYVTAVDGNGNESDSSNTVTITTNEETKKVVVTGNGAASYNDGTRVRYIVKTSGTIESAGTGDLESIDRDGGPVAAGRVPADGSDTDTFSLIGGDLTGVSTWGGDVTVTVDGTIWSE